MNTFKRFIVSAPFGNRKRFQSLGATPTLGTFTLHRRGGFLWRLWRIAASLRYYRRAKSWINKLGLPNPGIDSLLKADHEHFADKIVSVQGFDADEWSQLVFLCRVAGVGAIELNLSCPNVNHSTTVGEVARAVSCLKVMDMRVIAKLPPVKWMRLAEPLYEIGVREFHLCNTIPTPGGGISGKALKQYSLWAVEEVKGKWGDDVVVIGGGGITCEADVIDYANAGADHFAIGSALLWPWSCARVKRIIAAWR